MAAAAAAAPAPLDPDLQKKQCDVWGVGMIMLEMCMVSQLGKRPWGSLLDPAVIQQLNDAAKESTLPSQLKAGLEKLGRGGGDVKRVANLIEKCLVMPPSSRIDLVLLKSQLAKLQSEMEDPYRRRPPECSGCRRFSKFVWLKEHLHVGHQKITNCPLTARHRGKEDDLADEARGNCDKLDKAKDILSAVSSESDIEARLDLVVDALRALPTAVNPLNGVKKDNVAHKRWLKEEGFPCEALPILDAFFTSVETMEDDAKSDLEASCLRRLANRCVRVFGTFSADCKCRTHVGKWQELCPTLSGGSTSRPSAPSSVKRPADAGAAAAGTNEEGRARKKLRAASDAPTQPGKK
mmetsp:Transcript_31709/g.95334  ORF Transcript_31709/g.95334 Transcript_31709/m.95334 type:complete len:351 (+) Transcript_31709:2-1054(+)